MRLLGILLLAAATGGCTPDTALGDPLTPTPVGAPSPEQGSIPPVGHGGPLDHRPHPSAAGRGASAGMEGEDHGASGTLSRPIDARDNTGFADADATPRGGGDRAAQGGESAPITVGNGDSASSDRDRELNQRIRLALADDREVAGSPTSVRLLTVEGVVTLQGQVATPEGKARIEKRVATLEGVKRVQNHLAVNAQ